MRIDVGTSYEPHIQTGGFRREAGSSLESSRVVSLPTTENCFCDWSRRRTRARPPLLFGVVTTWRGGRLMSSSCDQHISTEVSFICVHFACSPPPPRSSGFSTRIFRQRSKKRCFLTTGRLLNCHSAWMSARTVWRQRRKKKCLFSVWPFAPKGARHVFQRVQHGREIALIFQLPDE